MSWTPIPRLQLKLTLAVGLAACGGDLPSTANTEDPLSVGGLRVPIAPIGLHPGTYDRPQAPSPVRIVSNDANHVTVRFRDQSGFEDGNELKRSTIDVRAGWNESAPVQVGALGPVSGWNDMTDPTIEPDDLLCYQVRAFNEYGGRLSEQACNFDTTCIYSNDRAPVPPRSGVAPLARVRLLSQNVFGTDDGDCSQRTIALGQAIATAEPPFDVVGLQEHYDTLDFGAFTCSAIWFNNAVVERYAMNNSHRRFHYPHGEILQGEPDGGVGVMSLGDIVRFEEHEWHENNWSTFTDAVQGFVFARVRVAGTSIELDTYSVHLDANVDGGNRNIRRAQLSQLADEIRENSATSGNPVIVMGDFNIGAAPTCDGNAGYNDIMYRLGHPRDLWMEAKSTDGAGTHEGQRLDYILLITDPDLTNNPYAVELEHIDRFRVTTPAGEAASDHDGVEATLVIRQACPYAEDSPQFCSACGPCVAGKGDCDNDSECAGGLVCRHDVGASYGLPAHYDVCECPWAVGSSNYCRDCGPCTEGQGDCDGDAQCAPGLHCANDVGADYGLPANYDVCRWYLPRR